MPFAFEGAKVREEIVLTDVRGNHVKTQKDKKAVGRKQKAVTADCLPPSAFSSSW